MLVDKRTATGVDQYCARLHHCQRPAVDHLLGVVSERAVQRDDVAGAVQFVKTAFPYTLRQFALLLAREGIHLSAKGESYLCYLAPYVAQPYDAHLHRCEFAYAHVPIAEVGVGAPASVAVVVGIAVYTVQYIEDESKDMLRHAVGAIGGNVSHCHSMTACRLYVHGIVSSGKHTDIFQFGELLQFVLSQIHLIGKYCVSILRPVSQLLRKGALVDYDLAQFLERFP